MHYKISLSSDFGFGAFLRNDVIKVVVVKNTHEFIKSCKIQIFENWHQRHNHTNFEVKLHCHILFVLSYLSSVAVALAGFVDFALSWSKVHLLL